MDTGYIVALCVAGGSWLLSLLMTHHAGTLKGESKEKAKQAEETLIEVEEAKEVERDVKKANPNVIDIVADHWVRDDNKG